MGADEIQRLARRAAAGDLASARALVRLLEAKEEPDRQPGVEWVVVRPDEKRWGEPTKPAFIAAPKSRKAAIKIAREYGADEAGYFAMVRKHVVAERLGASREERIVRIIDSTGLLADVADAYYEHPGYVSVRPHDHEDVEFACGFDAALGDEILVCEARRGDRDLAGYEYDGPGDATDEQHARWIADIVRHEIPRLQQHED